MGPTSRQLRSQAADQGGRGAAEGTEAAAADLRDGDHRGQIEAWQHQPIEGEHPYLYLDGIVLKRTWAGEVRNVSLLVAISVNNEGYRQILGIVEGAKEDKAGAPS